MDADLLTEAGELVGQQRYGEALELYRRGDGAMAWYGQGGCLYRLGRYQEAKAALERCVELAPDFAEAPELLERVEQSASSAPRGATAAAVRPRADGTATGRPPRITKLSGLFLVLTGLGPLWGVLFLGWHPVTMLGLIWMEVLIRCFFDIVADLREKWRKLPPGARFQMTMMMMLFQWCIYGLTGFWLAVALLIFYGVAHGQGSVGNLDDAAMQAAVAQIREELSPGLVLVVLTMAASYGAAVFTRGHRPKARTVRFFGDALATAMVRMMGLTFYFLFVGLLLVTVTGQVFLVLALYVAGKTAIEFGLHARRSGRKAAPVPEVPPPPPDEALRGQAEGGECRIDVAGAGPPPRGVRLVQQGDALAVTLGRRLGAGLLTLFISLIVEVPLLLACLGGPLGMLIEWYIEGGDFMWMPFFMLLFFGVMILFMTLLSINSFLKIMSAYYIEVRAGWLRAGKQGLFGRRTSVTTMPLSAIRSVKAVDMHETVQNTRLYRVDLTDADGHIVAIAHAVGSDVATWLAQCFVLPEDASSDDTSEPAGT